MSVKPCNNLDLLN